jgi:hypothetical protein
MVVYNKGRLSSTQINREGDGPMSIAFEISPSA